MSDAPQHEPKPQAHKSGGGLTRIILIIILLIMLGLAGLEYYSRNASTAAFKQLETWVDDVKRKGKSTPEDVRELLGREPDNGLEDMGDYYQEVYSWRRGRLYDTYFLKVLYEKSQAAEDEEQPAATLHEVVLNTDPKDGDVPRAVPAGMDGDDPAAEEGGEEGGGEEGDEENAQSDPEGDSGEESPQDEPAKSN